MTAIQGGMTDDDHSHVAGGEQPLPGTSGTKSEYIKAFGF